MKALEFLGGLVAFALLAFVGMFANLLYAVIVLNIAGWFHLGFITQFTILQVWGILFIVSLIITKFNKKNDKKDGNSFSDKLIEALVELIGNVVGWLIAWGMGWVMFQILNAIVI